MGEKNIERGHMPFTAYVDHSFNPSVVETSPTKNKSAVKQLTTSDLQNILKTNDRRKIKSFIRDGQWSATEDIRRVLWWRVSCAVHKDVGSADIYEEMVKEVFGEGTLVHDVTMPTFVDMTTKEHYHLSDAGVHVAKKVMCILGNTCPDITYAPLVFPLACLFLHYMDESDCYNCLYGLLRSKDDYVAQTKKAHEVTKYILKDLAKSYCKNWTSYISKRGLQTEGVLHNWIWWIFRDLPFSHLVRVLDCYLVEGPKILFRVGLAILLLFYKIVVKPHPSKVDGDVDRALVQFCEDIPVSPEKLLKTAFGIRGLSRKEIRKHKLKCEMYVESLKHAPMPHTIPKSDSCESLNLKVSRSFSGPMSLQYVDRVDSNILDMEQTKRPRSSSYDHHGLAQIANRCPSQILRMSDWQTIWPWLPTRVTLNQPVLLYTSAEHGTSLMTFYAKIDGTEPTLLVIKTTRNEILGAYCTDDWGNRAAHQNRYYGTGESFVFTMAPRRRRYQWVGIKLQNETPNSANQFMRGDNTSLQIGGGGGGVALSLDDNLYDGHSQRCATFDNEPLAASGDFQCLTIEVFGFVEQQ